MARRPKNGTLSDGWVLASKAELYTVPRRMVARIRWVSLYNKRAGAETVQVFIRRRGTSRQFAIVELDASGGQARVVDEREFLTLSAGDAIEAQTTTAEEVSFVVSGEESAA